MHTLNLLDFIKYTKKIKLITAGIIYEVHFKNNLQPNFSNISNFPKK